MKRGIAILAILFLLVTPLILAEDNTIPTTENPLKNIDVKQFAKDNPWNETVIISPVWQTLIGGFFGLNLHNESTEISVRETMVFFMVFIMFFVIISDIMKMVPLFEKKIPGISGKFLASIIITILVSITGAFINLKNVLIHGIAYTIAKLNWTWLNNAVANRGFWAIFVGIFIIIGIFIIHEVLSWAEPLIKKYSQVSRAEAKGRMMKTKMEESN